jgi:putative flippase GtrA
MQKMKALIRRVFKDQGVRFLFVGALNTFVGYGVYALLIYLRVHYFLAQLVSSGLAITNSYLWNKYFTFKSPEKSLGEVLRFLSVYAVVYLMNMLALYVLIDRYKVSPYIAGAVTLFLTTLISYFGHDKFSFKRASGKK